MLLMRPLSLSQVAQIVCCLLLSLLVLLYFVLLRVLIFMFVVILACFVVCLVVNRASYGKTIIVLELHNELVCNGPIAACIASHTIVLRSIACAPNGNFRALGSKNIIVFILASGTGQICPTLEEHRNWVLHCL